MGDALETFIEGLHQLGLDTHGPPPRVPARGTPTIREGRELAVYSRGTPCGYPGEGPGGLVEQFLRYRQELLDWNTRINLTAITEPGEVLIKHFLDSLSLLIVYDRPEARL